jgi:hypothetical protein
LHSIPKALSVGFGVQCAVLIKDNLRSKKSKKINNRNKNMRKKTTLRVLVNEKCLLYIHLKREKTNEWS